MPRLSVRFRNACTSIKLFLLRPKEPNFSVMICGDEGQELRRRNAFRKRPMDYKYEDTDIFFDCFEE